MRTLSAALKTVLANGPPYVKADLWTLTLADGTILRWTSSQVPLTVGGNTFEAGPPITRGDLTWKMGLEVDELKAEILDDGNTTINGIALMKAAWQNLFDDAAVRLDRFVSDSWGNTAVGSTEYFTGIVGDVHAKHKKITLTVESQLAQLKATFPRTYVLPTCANTLYDGVCGVVAANFTFAGTVGAGATASQFPLTLTGGNKADGYFEQGKLVFTSGVNAGQVRAVKSYVGGVVTLTYPLYAIPAQGDTLNAIAGCDKTVATCTNRFNNFPHFRGFKFVPDPAAQYGGMDASAGGGSGTGGGGGGDGGGRGGGNFSRRGGGLKLK